jgi:Flp pilus assembly protein TadG
MRAGVAGGGGERGAAVVEFALVLPLLLVLVLGAIDWGYFFYVEEVVTNAAREGARAGCVISDGAASNSTAVARATGYLSAAGLSAAECDPSGGFGTTKCCIQVPPPSSVFATDTTTVQVLVTCRGGSVTGFTGVPPLSYFLPATTRAYVTMRR